MSGHTPAGTGPPGAWMPVRPPGMCLPLTGYIPARLARWDQRKLLILGMILLGCTHLER